MIDFVNVKGIQIPEGVVRSVTVGGALAWKLAMLNIVPYSIDADGTIYNECGYMDDYRLSSSGTPTQTSGATHTGFIGFSNTDVIRAKGSTGDSSLGGQYIIFFDEGFNKVLHASLSSISGRPCASYELQPDGQYLLTVDISTALTDTDAGYDAIANARYFRISFAQCKGKDMIVTINEPIE